MKINKSVIIVISALILVSIIGGSYAWLTITKNAKNTNNITVGTLEMNLDDEMTDGIKILNAVPIKDETGKKSKAYKFTLENTGTITSDYSVSLESQALDSLDDDSLKNMPQNRIKCNFTKVVKTKTGKDIDSENDISSDSSDITRLLDSNPLFDTGSLEPNQYIEYELRLWIDEEATSEEIKGTAYIGKIKLEAKQQEIEE